MGLAFGYFNEFWWFFCFKNSGFVFNERVGLYFYDKRVASPFSWGFTPNPKKRLVIRKNNSG
ncbi:hypothetical protein BTURTLESOX_515 [bacterium endosymbiont of Bathymodiolus sp. 5 South]|jgi:hypothetical protein|nr:hypothetical protein BTURTLESOX_515 [bacterium endosymbiont of Bathymodiolus sp. 5 South]